MTGKEFLKEARTFVLKTGKPVTISIDGLQFKIQRVSNDEFITTDTWLSLSGVTLGENRVERIFLVSLDEEVEE